MKKTLISIFLIFSLFIASASVLRASAPLDSDNDGVSDDLEIKFGTDKDNPDSDNDGYKDSLEIDWGYNPTSTSTAKLAQKVEVDLKNQKLYYLVSGNRWKEFKISSGKKSMPTPKGDFKITSKSKKAWSKTYGLWMPNWLGLNTKGIGIHELPIWPNGYREGENHLGTPVSHGCVRLGVKEAPYLFDRLGVGTNVKIY